MANFVYNVGLGRVAEKVADGATIKLLVLKAADADATLKDADTVAAVLANAGTTEADFTNYARATLASLTVTVDDSGNKVDVDAADVVFTAAGGASNNTTTDVIIYEEVTTDSDSIPLVQLDAVFTTDGNDVTLQFGANGWFSAS
jgi:hypothetical protein